MRKGTISIHCYQIQPRPVRGHKPDHSRPARKQPINPKEVFSFSHLFLFIKIIENFNALRQAQTIYKKLIFYNNI